MSDVLLIIGGIALLLIPFALISIIIQALRKKPKKKSVFVLLGLLGIFIIFESAGIATMCDHDWIIDEEVIPTCTIDGNRISHCSVCDKTKTEKIKKLGHDLMLTERVDSTIQAEGRELYICSRCGYQDSKSLPQKDCKHEWINATCTESSVCKACGKTQGAPKGHSWVDATCQTPKTCDICGATQGNLVEHTWNPATCTESSVCKVCGETSGTPKGHMWVDATCQTPKTCSVCGSTQGKLAEHKWQETTEDAENPTCSVCGKTEIQTKSDEEIAQEISDRIDLIGTVTLDREETIINIKNDYDQLTKKQKRYVKNYDVLENCIEDLNSLIELEKTQKDLPKQSIFISQKSQCREFSGEYRCISGDTEGLPNVIRFDEDGTGHYWTYEHMYIFDYKVSSNVLSIDTHEEFLPIYHGEIDILCARSGDYFKILDATYQKKID